jgi:hypothetical protein
MLWARPLSIVCARAVEMSCLPLDRLPVLCAYRPAFESSEVRLISSVVQASSNTQVAVSVVALPLSSEPSVSYDSGVVRVDVRHIIRPVIHHFESNLDGHERTYVFHVCTIRCWVSSARCTLHAARCTV